jgi:putative SOS response-associated peptidase YedK
MCSRYSLISKPDAAQLMFDLAHVDPFPPRYNIAPTQPVAIVRRGASGARELALVRWGLIPGWVKDPGAFATLVNARAESAVDKPSFRAAFRHRRCLVPTDGFYEWTGRARTRTPHLIRRKDRALFALAGLWEHWLGADGSEIETMAILTIPSVEPVASIHDRMPAILPPEHFETWLDCLNIDAPEAAALLKPPPTDLYECFPVNPRLNDPRADGADLQAPAPPPDRLLL